MKAENKFYLEADIKLHEETADLRKAASSVIKLPQGDEKQMDLQYFSAVFVSSGTNLNGAHFLSSELVKAEGTIINKALDIEHKEEEIIGHLYDRAFVDKEGKHISVEELASMETASLDTTEIHVVIAGIIYKNRFPEIAEEVVNKEWKVSMECYYQDFDIKIGDLILPKNEAEALGIALKNESIFGKVAKVIKNGIEIAQGNLVRALRGICFSGCGIVKDPANPPSVILETARAETKDVLVFNYDVVPISNTKEDSEEDSIAVEAESIDKSEIPEIEEQSKLQDDDSECLKNEINNITKVCINKFIKEKEKSDRRNGLVEALNTVLGKAERLL